MSKLTLTKGTVRRVACPVCKAEPGNWCRLSRGKHKGLLIDECHKARAVLAALDEDKSYAKAKRAAAKHNHKGGDLGLISAAINPVKPVSRYQTERENKVMAQMDSLRPVASFAIGDIVEFTKAFTQSGRRQPLGKQHVITAISFDDGYLEYGVNGNAWFHHADLILVQRATKRSLKQAARHIKDE
jgi:hypothetical protein